MGGGGRRGGAGQAASVRAGPSRARARPLPAGRAPPAARRPGRRRAGVPGGQPARTRAGARHRAPAAGGGQGRRRRRRRAPHGRGEPRAAHAPDDARRRRRDHARRRRRGRRLGRPPRSSPRSPTPVDAPLLHAIAAYATGSVLLAEGEAHRALASLRRACAAWRELEMPYDAARARVQIGLACRALGDHDAAEFELDAARATFELLGARPDLARVVRHLGRRRTDAARPS